VQADVVKGLTMVSSRSMLRGRKLHDVLVGSWCTLPGRQAETSCGVCCWVQHVGAETSCNSMSLLEHGWGLLWITRCALSDLWHGWCLEQVWKTKHVARGCSGSVCGRVCQETHAVLWIALVQLDMPRQVNAGTACVAVMQVVKPAVQLTRYS
jgi:hypothetical protein